ncbi:MarR family winged helix-turn-helix transcriptional regulator [Desulfatibacillum aliphaticivorans]|uniref:MarR family winged helix-turn-helix transcriptional regulator n=1 Tax=Desulfatibacillum aliphaticivorans TaxID=218208 RepID=UPI00041DAA48|nr:MarR family transcriptional regulator [Desulfatibacillum aliphaticivorans]
MKTKDATYNSPIDAAAQLHRSALHFMRALRSARTEKSLTSAKLAVLGRLHRAGAATASDLSSYLRVMPQSLTRLIAELEKEGLISRKRSREDRRRIVLDITREGASLLTDKIGGQRALLARVIDQELSVEEQELLGRAVEMMDKMAKALEALQESGEPQMGREAEEAAP